MKVLASVYACSPFDGSERAVGWNWVVRMSGFHEMIALTGKQYQGDIERWQRENPGKLQNVRFVFVDVPGTPWHRGFRGERLYYILWQVRAARLACEIARKEKIDLVHHMTYVTCVLPTLMHRVPAPFLLGPVAGGDRIPPALWRTLPLPARCFETVRQMAQWVFSHSHNFRKTVKKAALILAATEETATLLPSCCAEKVSVFQAVGLAEDFFQPPPCRENHRPLRFLMVGRMSYLKGFALGIGAFRCALEQGLDATLTILGDTEQNAGMIKYRRKMEHLCGKDLGVRIFFADKVDFGSMKAFYDGFDVLMNCALRDSGCLVVMEAMARGLAVISLDTGGPRVNAAKGTAVKIPPKNGTALMENFTQAILYLAANEQERRRLGDAARAHALACFGMKTRADRMNEFYQRVSSGENSSCRLHF